MAPNPNRIIPLTTLGRDIPSADRIGRFDAASLNLDACFGFCALIALAAIPVLGAAAALVFLASGVALAAFRPVTTGADLLAARWLFVLPGFCLLSAIWSLFPGETLRAAVQLLATCVIAILVARRLGASAALTALTAGLLPLVLASVLFGAYRGDTGALVGLFGSKNEMAGMSAILALAGFGLALRPGARLRVRMTGGAAILTGCLAILLAQSLGALIYLPFGLAAWVAARLAARLAVSARLTALLFALLLLGLAALAIAAQFALASATFFELTGKDLTLTGRIELWQVAMNLIAERPLLGTGFQAFWVHDHPPAEALWTVFGIESRSGFNFHNAALSTAVETGLIGAGLHLALIGAALVRSGRAAMATGGSSAAPLFALAAMLALVTAFEAPVFYQFNLQSVILLMAIVFTAPRARASAAH